MIKAIEYRIYPNKEQEELLQKTFGCTRFVYNYFLEKRITLWKEKKESTTRFKQDKELTELKKEIEWLKEPDKCALQNAVKDLDAAYRNFFNKKECGHPNFKSKRKGRKSYSTDNRVKVDGNRVFIPKLKWVKCRVSKEVDGKVIGATIKQSPSGKYFISIRYEAEHNPLPKTGKETGIDVGVKEMAITSDGRKFANNKRLNKSEKKLARLQRQLSRKSKGSNRRAKARIKVARQYEKISNQRKDDIHKATTELARNYDLICVEDLNVKGMVKNHRLAKSVSDASMGEFHRQLAYKCEWYGKKLVKVDRFYPSSQLCSECGYRNREVKDLSVRMWTCPECGVIHDRDINAAKNILAEGKSRVGHTQIYARGDCVRRVPCGEIVTVGETRIPRL